MITYRNYINGQWQESASSKTIENINPARISDVLGTVKPATREEARAAVVAGGDAFRDWRATCFHAREAHISFGGIKAKGIGNREQGMTALDFYTEVKVVYVDYTGRKREGNLY